VKTFSSRDELRFWTVFSYLIAYRIDTRSLTIIAVIHGKRDVEQLLDHR
jgi:plasmid stabilization system protein ParE